MEKIVPLWPIGYEERAKQALCHIWGYLNVIFLFLFLDSGFEYMNVLSCVYNEIEYLYQRFNKKLNRVQLLSPAECMLITKVSDDACQWNGHDVVISIGGIFFTECFVCCMAHEEKLSIQY